MKISYKASTENHPLQGRRSKQELTLTAPFLQYLLEKSGFRKFAKQGSTSHGKICLPPWSARSSLLGGSPVR